MRLTVNGEPLSKERVEIEYQRLLKAVGARLVPEELARRSREFQRQALEHAIGRQLLLLEARRLDIRVPPESVDRAVAKISESCGGEAGFRSHLKKLKLSIESLRRQIQEAQETEQLIEQITSEYAEPTEDEITAHFNDHSHEFLRPDTPPESQPSLATVRDRIRRRLIAARKNELLTATLARLRQSAVIRESETDS